MSLTTEGLHDVRVAVRLALFRGASAPVIRKLVHDLRLKAVKRRHSDPTEVPDHAHTAKGLGAIPRVHQHLLHVSDVREGLL